MFQLYHDHKSMNSFQTCSSVTNSTTVNGPCLEIVGMKPLYKAITPFVLTVFMAHPSSIQSRQSSEGGGGLHDKQERRGSHGEQGRQGSLPLVTQSLSLSLKSTHSLSLEDLKLGILFLNLFFFSFFFKEGERPLNVFFFFFSFFFQIFLLIPN